MNKSVLRLLGMMALVLIVLLSGCTHLPDMLKQRSIETPMATEPMKLMDDIPWIDYQKAAYTIYNGEKKIGVSEIEVMKSDVVDTYEIIKVKKIGTTEIQSGTTIRANSLMPIDSYYNKKSDNDSFKISTSYTTNWQIKTVTGKENQQSIELPEYYYDNESLLVILAALPFEEIDTFKLNDAIPLTAKIVPLSGKYLGKETLTVPYGEMGCYKITFGNLTFWYSNDEDRILYQYQDEKVVFKLTDLTHEKSE
ncbi:DUF3108 domain-containing protein [Desemzia sp. RIT804]|uniref:DUF3108 domain-containing protein n=1 Tax=Desemzia sp. RIT 804 TaxID=2810209 RepID=UPI0019527B46|nr:DUF3108 domain-containing protein [Desemzia sp. RIT 804]MBM6615061.1 DUF3108 domain-containing protein [Desemzia sp. RIT 804]